MMLTKRKRKLSTASLMGLVLTIGMTFGSGMVVARAISREPALAPAESAQALAGRWQWMFHGKGFATMVLTPSGGGFSGTVTESRIALNEAGELSKADPTGDATPKQISETKWEGSALKVKLEDGFAFTVTLTDDSHAEIHPAGAPANMKPIAAEKSK